MDCFGDYDSNDLKCAVCWLRDCCKWTRTSKQQETHDNIRVKNRNSGRSWPIFPMKLIECFKLNYK